MSSEVIHCVALGKYRAVAESIAQPLFKHNYAVQALLDEDSYTPESLDVVLRTLVPRPKALILGGNFSDEQVAPGIKVWEKYVNDVGGSGTALVRVPPGTLEKVGKEGLSEWIIKELDKIYKQ
jgi:hypothetical protein